MKNNELNPQLVKWQGKYENSKIAWGDSKSKLASYESQYDGKLQPQKGREVTTFYNFTKELIETEIDNTIPQPKVDPVIYTEKNVRLAKIAEDMLRGELKKLKMVEFNDQDERNTKIYGLNACLVSWNNTIKSHYTVGALDLKSIKPLRIVPQPHIEDIDDMDYIFVDFDLTKKAVKKRYGVDVSDEELEYKNDITSDTVTQHFAFYKNSKGYIGCFSWIGQTVVIDEDNYNARQIKVCKKCGATKPADKSKCICGSKQFEKRNLKYEELTEDKVTNVKDEAGNPIVIPAMSLARDEEGNILYRDTEIEQMAMNPITGQLEPVMEQIFDEMMKPIGERPQMKTEQTPYYVPTKVPYYTPQTFPVLIRKNISVAGRFLGDSDCETIKNLQVNANMLSTRVMEKAKKEGSILFKPKDLPYEPSNTEQVIEIETPDQVNMIGTKNLQFDTSNSINLINQSYAWARSVLGINDSFQGKADSTAISGTAKEAQISRALGRQESKTKMKNVYYSAIYRMFFEYMLAYADEPRKYTSESEEGETQETVFDRYDFLEQDEYGNWYYNDQFIVSIDTSGVISDNRQYMLESMQNDFLGGLYGSTEDPETLYNFWKDRAEQGYPNAKRQAARWKIKVEQQKQMARIEQIPFGAENQTVQPQNNTDQATSQEQLKNALTGRVYGDLGG